MAESGIKQTAHTSDAQTSTEPPPHAGSGKPSEPAHANPPRRPGVGCAVFVLSEKHPGRFLLGVRKGNGPDAGLSQLCGGHQEFGETWEETAYRETLEEAGVRLRDISFVGVVNSIRKEIGYHFVTIFMKGYIDYSQKDHEVRGMEPEKCEAWMWTSMEELPPKQKLFFALADFVEQGLSPFGSTSK